MIAYTASVSSEYTKTVSFVYIYSSIVFLLQANDFRQICQITFHREYAIYNNQFDSIRFTFLKLFFQRFHVIVFVLQLSSKRKATSVDNRSMVAVITNNIVTASGKLWDNTFIYSETGREAQRFIFSHKFCQLLFQFHMDIKSSVQQTRTGTSGSILAGSSNSCIDNALVVSQSHVRIRSEHQNLFSIHNYLCVLSTVNFAEVRIHTSLHVHLRCSEFT